MMETTAEYARCLRARTIELVISMRNCYSDKRYRETARKINIMWENLLEYEADQQRLKWETPKKNL
jgi:hypothetical protein